MTETSLVPEMAADAGYSFGGLVTMDGGGRLLRSMSDSRLRPGPGPRRAVADRQPLRTAGRRRQRPPERHRRSPAAARRRVPRPNRASRPMPGMGHRSWWCRADGRRPASTARCAAGEYASYVAENGAPGRPRRQGARLLDRHRDDLRPEIADARPRSCATAGSAPRNSLALLDADRAARPAQGRARSSRTSRSASCSPTICTSTSRSATPRPLWQKDGQLKLVSSDGTPIDAVRDDRFNTLPFVVGDGANTRVGEFQSLLGGRGRVCATRSEPACWSASAGGRCRWTSGIEVELPEARCRRDPQAPGGDRAPVEDPREGRRLDRPSHPGPHHRRVSPKTPQPPSAPRCWPSVPSGRWTYEQPPDAPAHAPPVGPPQRASCACSTSARPRSPA